jgi:hypothetical protein
VKTVTCLVEIPGLPHQPIIADERRALDLATAAIAGSSEVDALAKDCYVVDPGNITADIRVIAIGT